MTTYKEFHINQYLSVRLEREPWADKKTMIYVAGQPFIQCKFLLLNIPITKISTFDEIESIDEAAEKVDVLVEKEMRKIEIPPEVEFWGHCSNLQVWYEHEYDTRLIHSNLAFPLLNKLAEVGDPLAKKIFKEEVIQRYENGTDKTREYIRSSGILRNFSMDEHLNLILNNNDLIALTELAEIGWTHDDPYTLVLALIREEHVKLENKRVAELDLSGLELELEKFPKSILELKNLKKLVLSGNYFKKIPENIVELNSLKELWLDYNEITHLPDSICEITSLEKLDIGGNKIHILPEKIGNLTLLKTLELGSNELKELPESFYELKSLETLPLANNRLEVLPDSFCNLTSLKWLSLSNNNLKKLPECIQNFQLLEYLDVSKNPLTESSELIEKINKLGIKKCIFN